ncbi:ribonuclease hi [Plakobranchus ocellatus]|uniref:Ribonuclease hi n=1 Tax=Plakobranchus ocellatus TaxID=259542 RepID=A0AAV4B5C3_9GAST|nr:ribonuclease hi [Plakobranchus ocellatus]
MVCTISSGGTFLNPACIFSLNFSITFGPPKTSPHLGLRLRWFQFQNLVRMDFSDPSNYRPIALTSCLSKTLERRVNDPPVHVLESTDMLSKKWVSENGFRFSVLKTTCFHLHRQRICTEPTLHVDRQPIPVKGEAKF